MKLADVAIRRPVFTIMMIAALVVLGLTSYFEMNTDLFPEIDFPFVVVQVFYPGASAEAVETEVAKKIEDAIGPVKGVKHITSISQEGYALVFAEFMLEINGKDAAQDVREKVAQIRDDLPDDIKEPIIATYDPSSEPILSLTVSGERPLRDITDIVKEDIQKRLESVPGVGNVELVGGFEREINVFLDIDKLESYEIPVTEVQQKIQAANLEIPGGRVTEKNREYLVRTMGKLTSVKQFDDIVIDNPHGHPVYLKDIAKVIDGIQEQRSLARVNGHEAITLNITRQSGGNTVEVARGIKKEVEDIKKSLPADMDINIVVDNSRFIEDAIHDVLVNIYYGSFLAILVIFLFLADIRSTIISGIAIPTSIIATFTFMHALGFTINMMSMLALALAVGLLIDDAIVVIENIFRRLQEGEPPIQAAFKGTKEIGLAVMATTFTIMVVFLPVAFMKGIVGRFFFQFGMTVAFSVLVSLFVAFTLTPMLSSRWLKPEGYVGKPPKFFLARWVYRLYHIVLKITIPWNIFFDGINKRYRGILEWSLEHRFVVMLIATVVFLGSLYLTQFTGTEFMPESDEGRVIVMIETPPGTDLDMTSQRLADVEQLIRDNFDGIDLIFTTIGSGQRPVNEGTILVKLVDKDLRVLSAQMMIDSVRQVLASYPGIKYGVSKEAQNEGGGSRAAQLAIRGNDLDVLKDLAYKVENLFRSVPGAVDLQNNLQEGKPELRVNIDRKMANDLGLNVYGIGLTIRNLIEGDVVTRYKEGDREYDVRVRLNEQDRENTSQVGRLLIESNKEIPGIRTFLVPLSKVASLTKTTSIGEYDRLDRMRQVTVGANATMATFSGTIIQEVEKKLSELNIPPGYSITRTGTADIMQESFGYMFQALLLAVIFIYLLLASQFESFFDPLSIMFSLPLSLIGAILALLITGDSISIMSLIGIIMLMGLVTKNAILLIDFVKQNRYRGVERKEAILIAGPIRLRPIFMTSISLILGVLPIALGIGQGAEFRAPMARAVMGGMISSTALTLVVVPVVYTIIDDVVAFFKGGETVKVREGSLDDAEAAGQAG